MSSQCKSGALTNWLDSPMLLYLSLGMLLYNTFLFVLFDSSYTYTSYNSPLYFPRLVIFRVFNMSHFFLCFSLNFLFNLTIIAPRFSSSEKATLKKEKKVRGMTRGPELGSYSTTSTGDVLFLIFF